MSAIRSMAQWLWRKMLFAKKPAVQQSKPANLPQEDFSNECKVRRKSPRNKRLARKEIKRRRKQGRLERKLNPNRSR